MNGNADEKNSMLELGEIVLTPYGCVVVTSIHGDLSTGPDGPATPMFGGRLWRIPGKSIASSAYCSLRVDCILKRQMPAAPGMVVSLSNPSKAIDTQSLMIHTYSPCIDGYYVTPMEPAPSDNSVMQIRRVELSLASNPSSKFYPLLLELMARGDSATKHAKAFASENSSILTSASTALNDLTTTTPAEATSSLHKTASDLGMAVDTSRIENTFASASTALLDPNIIQNSIKSILDMLKDEDLVNLLGEAQTRLRQLTDLDSLSEVTQTALSDAGITFSSTEEDDNGSKTNTKEQALKALNDLMTSQHNGDLSSLTLTVTTQFQTVFDSLQTLSATDDRLNSIYTLFDEKTSEWQELTGKVQTTKAAGLFWEGTSRLQARAANLLASDTPNSRKKNGNDSSFDLTKSFTEGDFLLARLKSLELGEVVRNKLFAAVEARMGSQGGLDGIIAQALSSKLQSANDYCGDVSIAGMLQGLQDSANVATQNANETLVVTLGKESQYRDLALLQIERVLVNLDQQLQTTNSEDDDNSTQVSKGMGTAEEIMALVTGDDLFSTAKLFEPIALRATQEITNQIDALLSDSNIADSVTDPTLIKILTQIRKIVVTGELSLNSVVKDVVTALNDEGTLREGEHWIQKGEELMDVLESNKKWLNSGEGGGGGHMGEVWKAVEEAGLTKDKVMEKFEQIDIETIVETAETAATDEIKRAQLLSSAADVALDFLLRILPSMPVPPFEGVKDGLVYNLSNLSLEGFKVKKEDIMVEIAGIKAVEREELTNSNRDPELKTDDSMVDLNETESADEDDETLPTTTPPSSPEKEPPFSIKATELLIMDVQNISAVLENSMWSFEQTYFPYWKGKGAASVQCFDGSIRLQFELRRKKVIQPINSSNTTVNEEEDKWEPVLCLYDHVCTIAELDLKLEGEGKITWIFNKIATYFKVSLRNYVVKSITSTIGNASGALLEMLNTNLSPYWGMILKSAGLSMEDLAEVDEKCVTTAEPINERDNEVELVWREHLPLGMNLLMNDESGLVKIVEFPRGSQARLVVEESKLDAKVFEGATIMGCNGQRFDEFNQDELMDALKDPGRPKAISFKLANNEDAERIRSFVSGEIAAGSSEALAICDGSTSNQTNSTNSAINPTQQQKHRSYKIKAVTISDAGPIGIQFSNSSDGFALIVDRFAKGDNGEVLPAKKNGTINQGDVLISVNGTKVIGENGIGRKHALELFQEFGAVRPLHLGFCENYCKSFVFSMTGDSVADVNGPVKELIFKELRECSNSDNDKDESLSSSADISSSARITTRVILNGFENVAGRLEASKVLIGDRLQTINNSLVDENNLVPILTNADFYPLTMICSRPDYEDQEAISTTASRWASAAATAIMTGGLESELHTTGQKQIAVIVEHPTQVGCVFRREGSNIYVGQFRAVKGPFQRLLNATGNGTDQW
eukprot:CAMPEP_0194376146 /NCGR_PEP_ID=MMETSP0174-20130528/24627_1 /TAXON_ID=216777 /ORGANISM="Proboscia alata, Strain PI-D3" /LENGTH=1438 /DNA_ID=CAMNT_0039156715 /DNA_START=200 /DNA_END=4513 /DNA_ORIENTATION=-